MSSNFRRLTSCLITVFLCSLSTILFAEDRKEILIIETMEVPVIRTTSDACRKKLNELGWKDGDNAKYTILKADGSREKSQHLLKTAIATTSPDLIISFATLATQEAIKLSSKNNIPLLFAVVVDPVGAGIVKDITTPPPGVNGLLQAPFLKTKMKLFQRILPQSKKKKYTIGSIHSNYPAAMADAKAIKKITSNIEQIQFINSTFQYHNMAQGEDLMLIKAQEKILALEPTIDFWWQVAGPLSTKPELLKLIKAHSDKPIVMGTTLSDVKAGALMAVMQNQKSTGHELAHIANNILHNTPHQTAQIKPPSKFDFAVNITTALKMGAVIPSDLLGLAGTNVYK